MLDHSREPSAIETYATLTEINVYVFELLMNIKDTLHGYQYMLKVAKLFAES